MHVLPIRVVFLDDNAKFGFLKNHNCYKALRISTLVSDKKFHIQFRYYK